MAPKSANMDVYSRAAFLAAQVDSLLGPTPAKSSAVPEISSPQSQKSKEKPSMPARRGGPARLGERASSASRAKSSLRARRIAKSKIKISVSPEPSFEHHRRKCQICNHPEREAIEELFVNWHSARDIKFELGIYPPLDWSSIYRHARAAGLYGRRRKNLRAVFDLVLEHAADITPTAHGLVAIVRAYSCLTDAHKWLEPEKRVHITNHVYHHDVPADSAPATTSTSVPPASPDPVSFSTIESSENQSSISVSGSRPLNTEFLPSPTAAPSIPPAPPLATHHSPLATAVSNRHTPGIKISPNSHKTNARSISNRHISRPVSPQLKPPQKEKLPRTTLAPCKDNLAG